MSENLVSPQASAEGVDESTKTENDTTFWGIIANFGSGQYVDSFDKNPESLETEIFGGTEAPPEVETVLRSVALRFGTENSKWLFNKKTWFLDDESMRDMLERGERTKVESLASAIVAYYVSFD